MVTEHTISDVAKWRDELTDDGTQMACIKAMEYDDVREVDGSEDISRTGDRGNGGSTREFLEDVRVVLACLCQDTSKDKIDFKLERRCEACAKNPTIPRDVAERYGQI